MKEMIFRIETKKDIPIDFSEQQMKNYPVHEHYLIKKETFEVVYKYDPTRKTEQKTEQLKEYLIIYLKRKHGAHSVVVIK